MQEYEILAVKEITSRKTGSQYVVVDVLHPDRYGNLKTVSKFINPDSQVAKQVLSEFQQRGIYLMSCDINGDILSFECA